jgi:hypothetical protein
MVNSQSELKSFVDNLREERRAIDRRRGAHQRELLQDKPALTPEPPRAFPIPCDASGLALSGGGIRSASFCLGVLQGLSKHRLIDKLDYLSTVSGGGYIGSCLLGALQASGKFPFGEGDEVRDSPAVGHLRNYSNYLLPRGRSVVRNFSEAGAVILRGLTANAALILVVALFFALTTKFAFPSREDLLNGSFLLRLAEPGIVAMDVDWPVRLPAAAYWPFALTIALLVAFLLWLLVWAVQRSMPISRGGDVSGIWLYVARWLLVAICINAFLDLQPVLIESLARFHDSQDEWFDRLARIVGKAGVIFSMLGGVIAFVEPRLANFLKNSQSSSAFSTVALRFVTLATIYLAALALPILLLMLYLYLSAWLIVGDAVPGPFTALSTGAVRNIYLAAFIFLLLITAFLSPNANSLHRFYRDRLSKAFLFDPRTFSGNLGDPTPLDDLKLSQLREAAGPYPIINAALNIEGSAAANRRGRNAGFFTFTPHFVGSDLVGFADTKTMEQIDRHLDLATAMAISAAAAAANMGSGTVKPLSPTLALLNIRLGYWFRNPRDYVGSRGLLSRIRASHAVSRFFARFYLLLEMLNLLDENSWNLYLTDGGHIENLGLYQLLKRGCKLIIVVDAEADVAMTFPSFVTLERYARIDLGVRIDLPWQDIARMTHAVSKSLAPDADVEMPPPWKMGPHCAIGRIFYDTGDEGILVYVKSSLTGDEKDYVLDYKRRNPSFPHETTGDQFFSEQQFEAYRALGFHIADGFLSGEDSYAQPGSGKMATGDALVAIREALDSGAGPEART